MTSLRNAGTLVVVWCMLAATACSGKMILTEQDDARRIGSALHLAFVKASEAGNRAVMAGSDEAAAAAAAEADGALQAAQGRLDELAPIVRSLAYDDDVRILEALTNRFAEYRKVNAEVLGLAVENTNLKAQRLSFGAGQDAADDLISALAAIGSAAPGAELRLASADIRIAILEMQVVQARHIAEAEDSAMSRLEAQMAVSETSARRGVERLHASLPAQQAQVMAVQSAFDRFMSTNAEIVALSRRNSNVRSVAATLGRKRVLAAECEEQLQALESAFAAHTFKATK
jgi:hypothetical protein